MLKIDPDERFDINQVCMLCEEYQRLLAQQKVPLIDPYLVMDDIFEKLLLLDYEGHFC